MASSRCHVLEDDDGYGGGDGRAKKRSLQLKRPSGRPHGKVDVEVAVRETRYRAPPAAYGVPPPAASREYTAPPAYPAPPAYTAPPAYGSAYSNLQVPYYWTAPPAGYPSYSGMSFGQRLERYWQEEKKKKSKFGGMEMWTALAEGAAAGVAEALTGLVLADRVDYLVDKITDVVDKFTDVVDKLGEIVASDDDSEAATDEDAGAGDAYEDSSEDDDEDSSEDEGDLASEIDLPYGDDGGDDIDN